MDNSAWSVASLGLDREDLVCVDPVAAAQAINRAINKMTDGEVAVSVDSHSLNVSRFKSMAAMSSVPVAKAESPLLTSFR